MPLKNLIYSVFISDIPIGSVKFDYAQFEHKQDYQQMQSLFKWYILWTQINFLYHLEDVHTDHLVYSSV